MPSTVAESEALMDWLHVVAAVIYTQDGRILLAKRPAHKHQGGKWEFPGGKVEAGETPQAALQRELFEELDIRIDTDSVQPLLKVRHRYPDKAILLDIWQVHGFQGEATGKEGQVIATFTPGELTGLDFPAANHPIITAVQLPDVCLITPEVTDQAAFLEQLERCLQQGVKLVQLRVKQCPDEQWLVIAQAAIALAQRYDAQLLLNSPRQWLPDAAGLHLTSRELFTFRERPDYLQDKWLSASCHNAEELAQAMRLGVDFLMLSPVQPTISHPGEPALGWQAFAALVDSVNVPVFALGGLSTADRATARSAGAQGIVAISALWSAE